MILKWFLNRLLGENPILDLAENVFEQKLSFDIATQIASTTYFLDSIDAGHCREANEELCRLLDTDLEKAAVLSHLTLICATKIVADAALAIEIQKGHALLLIRQQKFRDALDHLSKMADFCSYSGSSESLAWCLMRTAWIHHQFWELNEALADYSKSRILYTRLVMVADVALCDQALGAVNQAMGFLDKAEDLYASAKQAFLSLQMTENGAHCESFLGDLYSLRGQHSVALEFYDRACHGFQQAGARIDRVRSEWSKGVVYMELGDFDRANQLIESARESFSREGLVADVARCNMDLGFIRMRRGDYENGALLFSSALELLKSHTLPFYTAKQLVICGNSCMWEGLYDTAIDIYVTARDGFSKLALDLEVATCDALIGQAESLLGFFQRAVDRLEKAFDIFVAKGNVVDAAKCRLDLGAAYNQLGKYQEAARFIKTAREELLASGAMFEVACCDMELGNIFNSTARFGAALRFYQEAKRAFGLVGNARRIAICNANLGYVYQALGDDALAADHLRIATEYFIQNSIRSEARQSRAALAFSCLRLGDDVSATKLFDQALETFREDRWSATDFHWIANLIQLFTAVGKYDEALDIAQSARNAAAERKNAIQAAIFDVWLATIYVEKGETSVAFKILGNISSLLPGLPNIWLRFFFLLAVGKAYTRVGKFAKAGMAFKKAINIVEGIRNALSKTEFRTYFLDNWGEPYRLMIKLNLETGEYGEALEFAEKLKSRTLAESIGSRHPVREIITENERKALEATRSQMRLLVQQLTTEKDLTRAAKLNKSLGKHVRENEILLDQLRSRNPQLDREFPLSVAYEDIRNLLKDNTTAIVEIVPLEDRTAVFVITSYADIKDNVVIIRDYDQSLMIAQIDELLAKASAVQSAGHDSYEALLRMWQVHLELILADLFDKVFSRLSSCLQHINRICFVPFGAMHLLPLHAMFTEAGGTRRYVIDDYTVGYVPSAKILRECSRRRQEISGKVVIALAEPGGAPNLPYSDAEVRDIGKLFGVSPTRGITRSEFISQAREANVLHFAGHAHPYGLVLHAEHDRQSGEEYGIMDMFATLNLPVAYLTTLSGCETGVIEQRGRALADEYVGLPSAFLCAGSRNVISSLWKVSDVSTSLLMKRMYELIRAGKAPSQALNVAQRWLKDPMNRPEHLEYLPEWCREPGGEEVKTVASGTRFSPGPIDPELVLPEDLSRPYHWAGWICSGAD